MLARAENLSLVLETGLRFKIFTTALKPLYTCNIPLYLQNNFLKMKVAILGFSQLQNRSFHVVERIRTSAKY